MLLHGRAPHVDVIISKGWANCLPESILAHLREGDTPVFAVDDDFPGTARRPEIVSA